MESICDQTGHHARVTLDRFSKEVKGVRRDVAGDCWCCDCHRPLPALWNNGKPQWIEEPSSVAAPR